ncbi:cardiolipin synthase [Swingsia samuiensis]
MSWVILKEFFDIGRWVVPIPVTLHALRHKRNTAACAGWIGVSWMSPYIGSALYLMFGINRVYRRARKMADQHTWEGRELLVKYRQVIEGNLAPLAKMLGRLTERPLMRGNSVKVFHDGDNTYPIMIEAIQNAQSSVVLCSYIFRDDVVGEDFAEALINAHTRGVEVRVLVDGIGSGYFRCPIQRRLRKKGVPCARFMHSIWPWKMPFINLRNHRKILVVDGRVGFMGGLNIGAENVLSLKTKIPVADTHFLVKGPVVHQLAVAFAWDWSFTTGETLKGTPYLPEPGPVGDIPMRVVTSGPDMDLEKIEYGMLQALTLAKKNIRFMTPYFLPDERFSSVINLAAARGVVIDIVVPQRSNHRIIDYARDASLRPYLDAGCRIWMADPPFNHSKLMVVDDEWSFVGSTNLDVRSLRLNFEVNLEMYDIGLATELSKFIDSHKKNRLTHHDIDRIPFVLQVRNEVFRLFMPYL